MLYFLQILIFAGVSAGLAYFLRLRLYSGLRWVLLFVLGIAIAFSIDLTVDYSRWYSSHELLLSRLNKATVISRETTTTGQVKVIFHNDRGEVDSIYLNPFEWSVRQRGRDVIASLVGVTAGLAGLGANALALALVSKK